MTKKSTRKEEAKLCLDVLKEHFDIELIPKRTLCIYGPPAVGKSIFCGLLCGELALKYKCPIEIIAFEQHYQDGEYRKMIEEFIKAKCPDAVINISYVESVYPPALMKFLAGKLKPEAQKIYVIDSLSAYADRLGDYYLTIMGTDDIRPITARVAPLARILSRKLADACGKSDSIGIVIAHASSTAGTGKIRGVIDFKPSFTQRVAHNLFYMVFLDLGTDGNHYMTCVINRLNKEAEGRAIVCQISKEGVKVLKSK